MSYSKRFVVMDIDDAASVVGAENAARWPEDCWVLVDTNLREIVNCDGGEPEDQVLVRDWAWVPELANRLDEDAQSILGELNRLEEEVVRLRNVESAARRLADEVWEVERARCSYAESKCYDRLIEFRTAIGDVTSHVMDKKAKNEEG